MVFFNIDSPGEIVDFVSLASEMEFSTKKPGNIGPDQSFDGVNLEDYHRVNQALHTTLKSLINKIKAAENSENLSVGKLIYSSVVTMMQNPPHKNLLLGYILLYAPLVVTALSLRLRLPNLKHPKKDVSSISWEEFWDLNQKILENSTVEDGVWLYRAINLSNAGGLKNPGGKPLDTEFDFTKDDIEEKIREKNQNLLSLFKESAHFDRISMEYLSNFEFCRNIVKNWIIPNRSEYFPQNYPLREMVAPLFLYILSEIPDSLIFRKNSEQVAQEVQKMAKNIQKMGGYSSELGRQKIHDLNSYLMKTDGKLNPGTTADLTACCILISLLFKI